MTTRRLLLGLGSLLCVFAAMQAIPYGRTHANPPVTREPVWDSARTREPRGAGVLRLPQQRDPLAGVRERRADVVGRAGRRRVRSRRRQLLELEPAVRAADAAATSVITGNMPPTWYRMAHPEARLSDEERGALAAGLDATVKRATLQARD